MELEDLILHSGQMHRFFEEPGRDMGPACLTGAFTAFQLRVSLHHVLPKLVLPPGQLFLVPHDFLSSILRQRDKTKVHMGRFLVHMHHGRDNGIRILMLLDKIHRMSEIRLDLGSFLSFEKLRAGGDQRFHHTNAV